MWETLGTRPSRLAWGEIYLGLKTGVVEAAEGPISSAYSAKFHEAATNVIRTDHLMSSAHITVNEKAFSALPADVQKLLADCAAEAVQNTRKTAQQETEDVVRKMAAEGAKVTPIDKAPIQQRATRRRGEDGEGRRVGAGAVGADPEALTCSGPECSRATSACSIAIGAVEQALGIALILLIVVAITVQVFTRYALGRPHRMGRGVGDLRVHLDGVRRRQPGAQARPAHRDRHVRQPAAAARRGGPAHAGVGTGAR